MAKKFKKGDILTFHGTLNGKRYTAIRGRAEEDGETGGAQRVSIRIKPGVIRVLGRSIYIIEARS